MVIKTSCSRASRLGDSLQILAKGVRSRVNFSLRCLSACRLGLVRLPALCSFNDSFKPKQIRQSPLLHQSQKHSSIPLQPHNAAARPSICPHKSRTSNRMVRFSCTITTAPPYPAVYITSCCTTSSVLSTASHQTRPRPRTLTIEGVPAREQGSPLASRSPNLMPRPKC